MKKVLAVFGLLLGMVALSHAGTPQDNYYSGQPPLSAATILASSATTVGTATLTLTVVTPTVVNSGGGAFNGRNCFTRFVVQIPTTTVVTIADNLTTVWTLYGSGIGTTGTNTLSLPEDHLGPFCTGAGHQTVFTLTPTNGLAANPQAINVEGYTEYGGTNNLGGPMY
jgi:hypothetical protein